MMSGDLLSPQFRDRTRTVLPLERLISVTENERSYTMLTGAGYSPTPGRRKKILKRKNAVKRERSYLCLDFDEEETDEFEENDGLTVSDYFDSDPLERRPTCTRRRMKIESISDDTDDIIKSAIRRVSIQGDVQVEITDADKPTAGCPTDVYLIFLNSNGGGFEDGGAFCTKIKFSNKLTVGDLWEMVAQALGEEEEVLQSHYIMTYTIKDGVRRTKYQLTNEVQFLFQTHLYSCWYENVSAAEDIPIVIEQPPKLEPQEKELRRRINDLIGSDFEGTIHPHLMKTKQCNNEEYNTYLARRTLQSYTQEIVEKRNPEEYTLSMDTENTEVNTGIKSRIPESGRKDIHFHYENQDFTESINVYMKADDIMKVIVCPAFFPDDLDQGRKSKELCFQLNGEEMFICGNIPLIDFTIIRRLIFREDDIHLLIIAKPNPHKDKVKPSVWPRVDPNVYCVCGDTDMQDVNSGVMSHNEYSSVSAWSCRGYFNFQVEGLTMPFNSKAKVLRKDTNISIKADTTLQIHMGLYHGEKCLMDGLTTSSKKINHRQTILWREKFNTRKAIKDIPKETKLMVEVRARGATKETVYWGNLNLVDVSNNTLKQGQQVMYLWPTQSGTHDHGQQGPNPTLPVVNNPSTDAPRLCIYFESRPVSIVYPEDTPHSFCRVVQKGLNTVGMQFPMKELATMLTEKIEWSSLSSVGAVHHLLSVARERNDLPFEMSFRLLDSDIADSEVRKLAVEKLNVIPIPDMKYYMLQLVQAIKFEWRHDNPLSRLLLKTALLNKSFGGIFFWCIRSELCQPLYRTRFTILLEAYLRGCGEDMLMLFEDQVKVHGTLHRIGIQMKTKDMNQENRKDLLEFELKEEKLQNIEFKPLYNPRLSLGNLDIHSAKCMTSKKKPIWLEFRNVDPTSSSGNATHNMIVKNGDDLRQDMLILRTMALIDRIWQEDNLDLHLIPYKCIATSCNSGVIEVVEGQTIANISPNASERELHQWLKKQHTRPNGDINLDKFHQAVVTFSKSLAGYSVVTFVLGITDRHNDNIMINKEGNIFHIDFGHILGNVKKFMGVSREWTPFILSPDFMFVMGGPDSVYFETFRKLCIRGFLSLRRRANIVLYLFSLMRHSGIPELTSLDELKHIRDSLYLEKKTEEAAEEAFNSDIDKSLKLNWTTMLNWWAHSKYKKSSDSSSS